MPNRPLKPGWQIWRFDQIAVNVNERVEPGETDAEYYVGLEHLDTDSLKIRRWGHPSDVGATKLKFRQGDIVIFSPAAEVKSGDDCFVRFATPHETTFKRVFFERKSKIRLQPRNQKYAPTTVEAKTINGIYRALIKYERL